MNLREVYQAFGEESEAGAPARQLLDQQHWYASIAEFDPKTGDALPLGLDTVLRRQANRVETTNIRDRLWRIVDHSRASIERIFGSLSENPRREQAILPIRDVRELNAASFIALSRRPGRNVREKLAGKPYMQAVRRYQSVDLPQNRLVKEFVTQLADLLELRKKHLGHEDELLGTIYHWLRTDEAQAISPWGNLPPNNTLLSHRDYRRVWDAWRWLRVLDDAIDRDFQQLEARAATVQKWNRYGKKYSYGKTLFGDMPVLFGYDKFTITPWLEPLTRAAPSVDRTVRSKADVITPVCVDLTYLRPRYAAHGSPVRALPEAFLWQRWKNHHEDGREYVDLELFDADCAWLHPDSTSVSSADLFFPKDADEPLLDWAAHAFVRKLSETFTNPVLVWLVPDFLNDFQLQVARRNINTRFPEAEPLPRSVAAVFERIDYSRIRNAGFQVLVVDAAGGATYATKLIARHDPELQERVPETRGFYWERLPHVMIERNKEARNPLTEMPYIDSDGRWNDAAPVRKLQPVDQGALRNHPQIDGFHLCITLSKTPVSGGIRLHDLQQRARDIPLWRDYIPELSIKVRKKGSYQRFYLVDRRTTIKPRRGVPVEIPVGDRFTLPAGHAFYQFPLFQGQDPDDLGYVARLESPSFPLSADATCRLVMTYTYGADDPYRLLFEPLDNSFKPVQAKWRPKTEEVITDAPAPEYPRPATWGELQQYWNAEKGKTYNFPEWATTATEELLGKLLIFQGRINTDWRIDRNGGHYVFAERDHEGDIFIHENALAGGASYSTFSAGDVVYFVAEERGGRSSAKYVAKSPAAVSKEIIKFIRAALYVPYIRTWSDGRSLEDPECPEWFRRGMTQLIPKLSQALKSADTPPAVHEELRFLFCRIHKDMPESVSTQLAADVETGSMDERSLGFALGDLSQPWQQDILRTLLSSINRRTLRVFALAIWRDEGFVRAFGAADLAKVTRLTLAAIKDVDGKRSPNKREVASFTRYCELLLGLLRSRDSEDQEVRMLLQPHQAITKELAEQVERATAIIAQASVRLESRVQVNLPEKPEGEDTPDLLYALRLYLTGDVGANAIQVTGVNDAEDDRS
ncbi:MAG TPA: hypothetical protein VMC83_30330 [Streptosporangiaceae bacterium]|nr:hypothetical protein [Streptosporangiaceae bacterium]